MIVRPRILVVGGGTAGLVVARNLSNVGDVTVLEVACRRDYPLIFKIPLLIFYLFRDAKQRFIKRSLMNVSAERAIPLFTANVLGGSSVVNGAVHVLGGRALWGRVLSKFGFQLEDLDRSYQKNFTKNFLELNKIRLRVSQQGILDAAVAGVLTKHGLHSVDMETTDSEGFGSIYNTAGIYWRSSVKTLLPIIRRFGIIRGCEVVSILYNQSGEVIGVRTTTKGDFLADIVILSAGTIGTNKILLQSRASCKSAKLSRLPIGRGVADHTNIRVNVSTRVSVNSVNSLKESFILRVVEALRYLIGRPSVLSGTGATSAFQVDIDGDGEVDTRVNLLMFSEDGRHGVSGLGVSKRDGFSLSITPITPFSRGAITLAEDKPGEIRVDPGYLTDERDLITLERALCKCLGVLRDAGLEHLVADVLFEAKMGKDLKAYARRNFFSGHHLIGGMHESVDSYFRVIGSENLYVCDASVFGEYVSSNIHASVIILADLFSSRLRNQLTASLGGRARNSR